MTSSASNSLTLEALSEDDTTVATWSVVADESDTSKFYLTTTSTTGLEIEWYSSISSFTTYGNGKTTNIYQMQFYKVGLDFSPVVSNPTISTSGAVASGTGVTITNTDTRDGAELYYSFGTALTPSNYTTAGTKAELTDNAFTYNVTAAGTLYVLIVLTYDETTYLSDVVSATFTLIADNEEVINFSSLTALPTSTTNATLT